MAVRLRYRTAYRALEKRKYCTDDVKAPPSIPLRIRATFTSFSCADRVLGSGRSCASECRSRTNFSGERGASRARACAVASADDARRSGYQSGGVSRYPHTKWRSRHLRNTPGLGPHARASALGRPDLVMCRTTFPFEQKSSFRPCWAGHYCCLRDDGRGRSGDGRTGHQHRGRQRRLCGPARSPLAPPLAPPPDHRETPDFRERFFSLFSLSM